jgi:hypothetical protein
MYFAKRVPKAIKERTEENCMVYNMGVADAFEEAVRTLAKENTTLWKAWYYNDFREYIPYAYASEYLDFEKYPLAYNGK